MISCIIESRVPFLISLFNFQGPIATLSRRQLKEYIILFSVCQYFFESFLRFFQSLFLSAFLDLFRSLLKFSLIDSLKSISHTLLFVKIFLKVFQNFFRLTFQHLFASLRKACIYYHFRFDLSTVFSTFFVEKLSFCTLIRVLSIFHTFVDSFSYSYNDRYGGSGTIRITDCGALMRSAEGTSAPEPPTPLLISAGKLGRVQKKRKSLHSSADI